MEFYYAKDLRAGNAFRYKNNLYIVIENAFNKTAMREGIVKCKVRNLRTGAITTEVLTGEKLEKIVIEKMKANFLYEDQNNFFFIDSNTYEQISISKKLFAKEETLYLVENVTATILRYEKEILGVVLPDRLEVIVNKVESAVQGNTVHNAMKTA